MSVEILNPGEVCIFYLIDGKILFSESVFFGEEFIKFDSKKTLLLQFVQGKTPGEIGISSKKFSEYIIPSSVLKIPRNSVVMMQNTTSKTFLDSMRAALAGLVIP